MWTYEHTGRCRGHRVDAAARQNLKIPGIHPHSPCNAALLQAGTLCLHALFVLFGAPLAIAWIKTASLSAYLSSLTFVPLACVLGRDTSAWIRIVSRSLPSDHGDLAAYLPAAGSPASPPPAPRILPLVHAAWPQTLISKPSTPTPGALVGAWVGAFPIPLDWDRPWQAWPITCAVGGTAGHMLGLAASLSVMTWTSLRSSKAKRD